MSHGRRCPHCLGKLESGAGYGRVREAPLEAESDDGDPVGGEAERKLKQLTKAALKPAKPAKTTRRRRRTR